MKRLSILALVLIAGSAQASSLFDEYGGGSGDMRSRYGSEEEQAAYQREQRQPRQQQPVSAPPLIHILPSGTGIDQYGNVYPAVAGGVINPRTGQFIPY